MKKTIKTIAFTAAVCLAAASFTACVAKKEALAPASVAPPSEAKGEKTDADYFAEANEAYGQGKYEDAVAGYDKALGLNPALRPAWFNKAYALDKLGRSDEALAAYDKAIELAPASPSAYLAKGHTLIAMKRYDGAIGVMESLMAVDKGNRLAKTTVALALIKRDKGEDRAKAGELLEQVLAAKTDDVAAARAYAMLHKKEEMLNVVRYLVKIVPAVRTYLGTDLEFEEYRDDPDFKAALAGEE